MTTRKRIRTVRLSPEEELGLRRLIKAEDAKAEELGLRATASTVIRNLIRQAVEALDSSGEPTQQVRRAPNVILAQRKLREGRR